MLGKSIKFRNPILGEKKKVIYIVYQLTKGNIYSRNLPINLNF